MSGRISRTQGISRSRLRILRCRWGKSWVRDTRETGDITPFIGLFTEKSEGIGRGFDIRGRERGGQRYALADAEMRCSLLNRLRSNT